MHDLDRNGNWVDLIQRSGQTTCATRCLLNHMFQTAKTGLPAEYSQIEETISPAVLKVLTDWVTASR